VRGEERDGDLIGDEDGTRTNIRDPFQETGLFGEQ
jgi:hypothetical protein